MRKLASLVFAGAALLVAAAQPAAAKWPMDQTMTIVVPWPAGTGADLTARVIADGLMKKWGNTVVVENKTGGAGSIGQAFVARAKPDGYTFTVTTPGPAVNNKLIYQSLPYDPLTDFTYVMRLSEDPMLLIAGPNLKANTLDEFIAYAKANPGKVQFGNPGVGTYAQMTQLAMQDLFGTTFNLVQYRGAPQMVTDLLGGQIDAVIDLAGGYMSQIQSGKLRALAVIGDKREGRLPEVKTMIEQGVNMSVQPWYGLEGPKGVPADIVKEMHLAVADILTNDENARAKMIGAGVTPSPSTPEVLEAIVKGEMDKWRPIVTKYNIRAD